MKQIVFNETWTVINENYYLQDFGGIYWQAVKREYEPKIRNAEWPEEVYPLLIEMVALLDDGHSMFLPQPTVSILNSDASTAKRGNIGITINKEDSGFTITKTIQGGSAWDAGIPEGSVILSVNGIDAADLHHALEIRTLLTGEESSIVTLEYKTPEGFIKKDELVRKSHDLFNNAVTLIQIPGTNILFLEIWNFIDETVPEDLEKLLAAELEQLNPSGIIIDLRKNLGGNFDTMLSTAAFFLPKETVLGTFTGKDDQMEIKISNHSSLKDLETLPLAVLIGPDTESASEVFAIGLQENERAIIIGQNSGGNVEGTGVAELPDGSRLIIAVTDYHTRDNYHIDGNGIEPDIYIENPRVDMTLSLEHDLQVQAAIEWLMSR